MDTPKYVIMFLSFGITTLSKLFQAKLRILYCCRDLEISETNQIKYQDVQKIYEKRFGTPLNRDVSISGCSIVINLPI